MSDNLHDSGTNFHPCFKGHNSQIKQNLSMNFIIIKNIEQYNLVKEIGNN
jgi:hypothetical protein